MVNVVIFLGSFAPYVEQVMNMMLPLLKFIFHDGVRSAAAECLPCLLVCARDRGIEYLKQMWSLILLAYKFVIYYCVIIIFIAKKCKKFNNKNNNFFIKRFKFKLKNMCFLGNLSEN